MEKKSVLGSSLKKLPSANLQNKAEPQDRVQVTTAQPKMHADEEKESPIGVLFRLNRRDHETVSDYARDKGWSMQELLEHGINALRRSDGLSEITGRPRGKKAGSRSK